MLERSMTEGLEGRLRDWRMRSPVAEVLDTVVLCAAAVVIAVVVVDDVVSWPTDRVLLAHDRLSVLAGWLLFPSMLWLMPSMMVTFPVRRHEGREVRVAARARLRRLYLPTRRHALAQGALLLLCVGVMVGGFAFGFAKGGAQELPGPRYQVSTEDVQHYAWTDVTPREYDRWQARYVREDGVLLLFGLFMVAGGTVLRRSRTAARG
ncbi:hypothetical protein [Kitasatospora viridis]|uniref:Uncharacterized protein n=1 Tax=Kitasatospora viridis TaxID=281105 RepID=A0A561UQD3_9ACTN|nr:hypothetical protein [Kitasatospora viridis]TWG01583.1 hypothetical protein FHX73_115484 [Kitasatospora viridis]